MKILVVDDETDVRFLFEQRFRKEIRNHELDFDFAYSGERPGIIKTNKIKI